jgi:hypothetical protein
MRFRFGTARRGTRRQDDLALSRATRPSRRGVAAGSRGLMRCCGPRAGWRWAGRLSTRRSSRRAGEIDPGREGHNQRRRHSVRAEAGATGADRSRRTLDAQTREEARDAAGRGPQAPTGNRGAHVRVQKSYRARDREHGFLRRYVITHAARYDGSQLGAVLVYALNYSVPSQSTVTRHPHL